MTVLTTSPGFKVNCRIQPARKGRQHLGFSPGGAMDQASYSMALDLLEVGDCAADVESYEIISSDSLMVKQDVYFVHTGAPREVTVNGRWLEWGCVYLIKQGNRMNWYAPLKGYRSYLCFKPVSHPSPNPMGNMSSRFKGLFQWYQPGVIRVILGPESFSYDDGTKKFTKSLLSWPMKVLSDSSRMGVRLNFVSGGQNKLNFRATEMISQPTNDGTVQVTPNQIIILTRDRQTIGGYPRLLNVIDADMDVLAQYKPGECFRFQLVDIEYAAGISSAKKQFADLFRANIGSKTDRFYIK